MSVIVVGERKHLDALCNTGELCLQSKGLQRLHSQTKEFQRTCKRGVGLRIYVKQMLICPEDVDILYVIGHLNQRICINTAQ
jgi:hypothetical protein